MRPLYYGPPELVRPAMTYQRWLLGDQGGPHWYACGGMDMSGRYWMSFDMQGHMDPSLWNGYGYGSAMNWW